MWQAYFLALRNEYIIGGGAMCFSALRRAVALMSLLLFSACACAIRDEDRAQGKPGAGQCLAAVFAKSYACGTQTTSPQQCPGSR